MAAPTEVLGGSCPSGHVCVFDNTDALGARVNHAVGDNDTSDVNGAQFNDRMDSWINNTGRRFCWYPDANYQALHGRTLHYMDPHGPDRIVDPTFIERNTASSLRAC